MFCACATQWSYVQRLGLAGGQPVFLTEATGIPAERVEAKARGRAVTTDADFWARFEVLEEEAILTLREQR